MKRASVLAIFCCAIAGLAVGASTPKKKTAVAPKTRTASKSAPKAVSKAAPKSARRGAVAQHSATSHAAAAHPATEHPAAVHPGTLRAAAHTGKTSTRRRSTKVAARRSTGTYTPRQIAPTPDRYREIQDALVSKGYLTSPATGVWDQQSADALRHFQQDQKLDPSGKLTARSLNALGLGAKAPDNGTPAPGPVSSLNAPSVDPTPLR